MAFSYKTPGAYIEEIVKLPPSVASVETAIPLFIGVTEIAPDETDKELVAGARKVNSLADYEQFYGFPDKAKASVDLKLNVKSDAKLTEEYYNNMYYGIKHYFDNGGGPCFVRSIGNYARKKKDGTDVSVNTYKDELKILELLDEVTLIVLPDLNGLKDKDQYYDVYNNALLTVATLQDKFVIIDLFDEKPTEKVAVNLTKTEFRSSISNNIDTIKYGASYFPFLQTTYNYDFSSAIIKMIFSVEIQKIEADVTINGVTTKVKTYELINDLDYKAVATQYFLNQAVDDFKNNIFVDTVLSEKVDAYLSAINNKTTRLITYFGGDQNKIDALIKAKEDTILKPFASNAFSLDVNRANAQVIAAEAIAKNAATTDPDAKLKAIEAANAAIQASNFAILAADRIGDAVNKGKATTAKGKADAALILAKAAASKANSTTAAAAALVASTEAKAASDATIVLNGFTAKKDAFLLLITNQILVVYNAMNVDLSLKGVVKTNYGTLNDTFLLKINPFFNSLFEAKLKEAFLKIPVILPPSPSVAGVYAFVDRNRGVWKAPANVSLNSVSKPVVQLSDLDQEDFNVDAENGKSINCIRAFVGRGNLVWGARTLAGNNNEWRYINVRRFFNMVEESCQNASRQFIFEPNDSNTWVRVKGMIDNYLTNLWRVGALQGAKPEHAFYTAVGLNQTMTADDILNGLLIVEIGLAVVRPAEFIVLRFSHKLAVS